MNGLRSYLWALVVGLTIAFVAWAGNSIVTLGQRVSAAEATQDSFGKWLDRVEDKLDQVLGRR